VNIFSQDLSTYKSIKAMNNEEKWMYELLKKSILRKSKDSGEVHFFPIYKVSETPDSYSFSTIIYDLPSGSNCAGGLYTSTYSANLISKKIIEPKITNGIVASSYGKGSDKKAKENRNITYAIEIYDQDDTRMHPPVLYSKYSDKPFPSSGFKNGTMSYSVFKIENKLDPSLYKTVYPSVQYANKNVAVVSNGTAFGIVNNKDETLVPFQYQMIKNDGFGIQATEKGKSFFIDLTNKKLSKEYDNIIRTCFSSYKDNHLEVRAGKNVNIIDQHYQEKLGPGYTSLQALSLKNRLLTRKENGKQAIVSTETWKELYSYNTIENMDYETMLVSNHGKYGLVSVDDKKILDLIYDHIGYLITSSQLFYVVKQNNALALFKDKKFLTGFDYDSITNFDSVFKVEKKGKFGLINGKGEVIVPVKYVRITAEKGGYYAYKNSEKFDQYDRKENY